MTKLMQVIVAVILLHGSSLFAANSGGNPFLMTPISLPMDKGTTLISKPAAIRLKDGAGVLYYWPGSAADTINHNTSEYFYPIYCDTYDDCYSFNGLPPGGTIQPGAEFSIASYVIGSTLYLDGHTTEYDIAFDVANGGGRVHSTSFYLNQPGCPDATWYLEPGLFGNGVCFSSPGNTWIVWFYPIGPQGVWTYSAALSGGAFTSVAFTVDPLVIKKISGDGLHVAANTNTGPRLIVQMQNKDGTPVNFSELLTTVSPAATVKSGRTTTAIPGNNIKYMDNATFSIDAPIGAAGTYTVTVTHTQADPNSPAVFTIVADKTEPPPSNTEPEQGNGGASDNPDRDSLTDQAKQFSDKTGGTSSCGIPPEVIADPINVTNGNALRLEVDYAQTGLSPLEFTRVYNSLGSPSNLMGNYWTTTYDRIFIPASAPGQPVRLRRPDGQTIRFNQVGSSYVPDPSFHGTLSQNGTGWRYTDTSQTIEDYNSSGKLTSITDLRGRVQTLNYSTKGILTSVTANTGESLTFAFNTNNQISTVTDQTKRVWTYSYDGYLNLTSVKDPSGLYHTYFYSDNNNRYLLTGVASSYLSGATEDQSEVAWEYDVNGLATASYFRDVSSPTRQLRRTDILFGSDGTTRTVMDGNQNVSVYNTQKINGRGFVNSIAGAGLATCGDDLSRQFDSAMNVISKTQAGHITTFNNYDVRGQFANRVVAAGTTEARSTDYLYDPRFFNKPIQISEPSVVPGKTKITTMTYDAYGNVTQKTVSGYRPNLDPNQPATAISRTWNFTYNGPYHQLSLIDGPRTDVTDTTTFAYNTAGRVQKVIDANTIVRRNNIVYTPTGNVASEDRPNGLHIAYAYSAGSDLLQTVIETQGTLTRTTSWVYDNDNRVVGITFSDGVNTNQTINFSYNNAGELSFVNSDAGAIQYTFDDQGNPTRDSYQRAPQGEQSFIQRTFDAYNRVNKVIGANNTIEYDFYPDGTLTQTKDGKQQSTQRFFDGLKRLTKVVRPDSSQIQYGYDAGGNLDQVIDPNLATTTYIYDDFHNKVAQISPDAGTTQYSYDSGGNLAQMTDANSHVTNYTYDAGNRLHSVDRQGTDYDETYTYDNCTNGVGFLCSVTNGAGETVAYQYDGFGDIAMMTTGNKSVSYQYDAQGHVAKITYPSGRTVNYAFNGGGQVTAVTVSENGNTAILAQNITYQPFGPVTGWTYGNNLTHTRTYDKQNWTRSIATPNVSTLAYPTYDANGNLQMLTVDGTSDQFTYDTFDELHTGSGDFGTRNYGYDEVGNRTSLTANGANSTYIYTPNSNRLSGQTGWSYTLDAAGNTVQKLATDGSGSGYQYVYSPHNRLIAVYDLLAPVVPKATYVYNALGQRSQKTGNGGTTRYVYGLDGKLLAETDAAGNVQQEYVYLNGAPLALLGIPQPSTPSSYDVSVDTTGTTTTAWTSKSDSAATGGTYYYLSMSKTQAQTFAYWNFTLPYAGNYDVYVKWIGSGETTTIYTIFNTTPVAVGVASASQTKGNWIKLGNFHFPTGLTSAIRLDSQQNAVANKAYLTADAARMVLTSADAPPNPNYKYVHTDHLGTPRAITDANGAVIWKATYDPFGQAMINDDVTNTGQHTTLNLRFPGQYFDAESGLHYNYFRDYDPSTGRYISEDPMGLAAGLNEYAYAGGNPISYSDRLGLDAIVLINNTAAVMPDGGYAGHAAVLVGNDQSGWKYFSENGINNGVQSTSNMPYATLADFESDQGTTFATQVGLLASATQDANMTAWAEQHLADPYNPVNNNCGDFVNHVLQAGDIKTFPNWFMPTIPNDMYDALQLEQRAYIPVHPYGPGADPRYPTTSL